MEEFYVLLGDSDGTLSSSIEPWGAAVRTEVEAKRYCREGNIGAYGRGYSKIKVFNTFEEAESNIFGGK